MTWLAAALFVVLFVALLAERSYRRWRKRDHVDDEHGPT
jgi:hypothetical protein